MSITIISCSLHPQSRSYVLAQQLSEHLCYLGVEVPLIDLRQHPLPLCGTAGAFDDSHVKFLQERVEETQAIILTVPIYNYAVNAAAKNMIELTGRQWSNKVVGFACAAGGHSSYMSVMSIANSLMLDFRCLIIPRFVYATGSDFGNDRTPEMFVQSEKISGRLTELAKTIFTLTRALPSSWGND